MENKMEILKTVIIIVVVAVIIIYNFLLKKDKENYDYNNIVFNESIEVNENKVEETSKIKVYVIGEVKSPGVVELNEGARIEDAIILAGGTTDKSDLSKINLAYSLEDGQKLYVPSTEEKFNAEYLSTENGEGVIETTNEKNNSKININTADINELSKLSGVGEALAQKIIDYRNENGKFKNIEDLKNVSGIGDKKFESLKESIEVK